MRIGYARISKQQETETLAQVQALTRARVDRLYREHASEKCWDRPELHRLLDTLQPGDVLVVWKLDRLSHSLKDLLHLIDGLSAKGIEFQSLTEQIDTTTPAGRMLLQMVGAFAEFERELIRKRTEASLATARALGRVGGRRPKLSPQQQSELVCGVNEERYTQAEAAQLFQVYPATVARLMARQRPPLI